MRLVIALVLGGCAGPTGDAISRTWTSEAWEINGDPAEPPAPAVIAQGQVLCTTLNGGTQASKTVTFGSRMVYYHLGRFPFSRVVGEQVSVDATTEVETREVQPGQAGYAGSPIFIGTTMSGTVELLPGEADERRIRYDLVAASETGQQRHIVGLIADRFEPTESCNSE